MYIFKYAYMYMNFCIFIFKYERYISEIILKIILRKINYINQYTFKICKWSWEYSNYIIRGKYLVSLIRKHSKILQYLPKINCMIIYSKLLYIFNEKHISQISSLICLKICKQSHKYSTSIRRV